MKKTRWYPKEVNPVRKGVYEIQCKLDFPWYRYWDGRVWYVGSRWPVVARWHQTSLTYCRDPWRGLTERVNFALAPWRGLTEKAE